MRRTAFGIASLWVAACGNATKVERPPATHVVAVASASATAVTTPEPTSSASLPIQLPPRDPACGPLVRVLGIRVEAIHESELSDAIALSAPRYAGFVAHYALLRAYADTERIAETLSPQDPALIPLTLPFPAHSETLTARRELELLVLVGKEAGSKLRAACAKESSESCTSIVKILDVENPAERAAKLKLVRAAGRAAAFRDAYVKSIETAVEFRTKHQAQANESEARGRQDYEVLRAHCGFEAAVSNEEAATFIGKESPSPRERRVILTAKFGNTEVPRLAVPVVHRTKEGPRGYLVAPVSWVGAARSIRAVKPDGTSVDARTVMIDDRSGIALIEAKDLQLESGVLLETEGAHVGQSVDAVAIVSIEGKLNDADGPLTVRQSAPLQFATDPPPSSQPILVSGIFSRRGRLLGLGTWPTPKDLVVLTSSSILTAIERFESLDNGQRQKLKEQGVWLAAAALSNALPDAWPYFILGPELAVKIGPNQEGPNDITKRAPTLQPALGKAMDYVDEHGGINADALLKSLPSIRSVSRKDGDNVIELSVQLRDGNKILLRLRWEAGRYVIDNVAAKGKSLLGER